MAAPTESLLPGPALPQQPTWRSFVTKRSIICLCFLSFLMHLPFKSRRLSDEIMVVKQSNLFIPLWYALCFIGGIVPTMSIQMVYGKWTAPPFNYPTETKKRMVIVAHVVPAVLWMVGSTVQLYFTTIGDMTCHRFNGISIMSPIFIIFQVSAMLSLVMELSPLGAHVKFMEWNLLLGTGSYFFGGMYFIAIEPKDHKGHMICMNLLMITALGPGFFRVLRHLRELVTGRIWKVPSFTNYQDVPSTGHLKNFRAVESTYFCMAFVGTTLYAGLVLWQEGVLYDEEWSMFCHLALCVPFVSVGLGICLRFCPCLTRWVCPDNADDFNFPFALNYNFNVLTDEPVEAPPLWPSGVPKYRS